MPRPLFAASMLVLAACASAPVARDVQRTAVIEGSEFGASWDTMNGIPEGVVQCVSTGLLEREIHDEVMGRALPGMRG